jgi:hypothetical protein
MFCGVQATVQAALGPVAFQLADAALRYGIRKIPFYIHYFQLRKSFAIAIGTVPCVCIDNAQHLLDRTNS